MKFPIEVPKEIFFCAGHAFLPDGKLLVAEGAFKYDNSIFGIPFLPFRGLEYSYIFDHLSLNWQRGPDITSKMVSYLYNDA